MALHASDVENKATLEQNAEKEYFATNAEATTTTQKHVENNITIS